MNYTAEMLTELFTKLKALEEESKTYIDRLPNDVCEFIYENTYSNNLGRQFDALLKVMFPSETVKEAIYEFLFQNVSQFPLEYQLEYQIIDDEKEKVLTYEISDVKSLVNYVLDVIEWENDV